MPKASDQTGRKAMPTSAARGVETRTQLMAAAAVLIAEKGWGGVTTRMVAERAGLPPGLVHYHFASVTDLLIDASLHATRKEAARVLDGISGLSATAGLHRMIDAVASYDAEDLATNGFSEMLLAATRHERLRAGMADIMAEYRSVVRDWLAANGTSGDAEATAALMFAAFDGLVLHRLIDPRVRDLAIGPALRRLAGLPAARNDEETTR